MPPDPVELRVGPFVESGRTITSVGYRDVLTGQVVSSVAIPSELVERAVLNKVSVEIVFSTDGQIAAAANGQALTFSSKITIHVDELVGTFLASNNLNMEEATAFDLRRLLERLQKSVRAVQDSIALLEQASN